MPEPSNKIPLLILAAALVVLLILLGVYHFWNRRAADDNATTTASHQPRVLTEEEKAQFKQMFATSTVPESEKVKSQTQNMVESYQLPLLSTKEKSDFINMIKQN